MSSARTARLIEDAYKNNDINAARSAINDYYSCHCLHPSRIVVNDSHTGLPRTILVGCGRCIHCMETKVNEWCTRMYAHAEDFKHVYFVTLTYRSITNCYVPANNLLLRKLTQAVWNYDRFNSTQNASYNPCLLVKSHYQNFLKRLRKNTGLKDITYVLSGEYGTKYGRPHFHLLLFTNGELTKFDIVRAWSVCLWRTNENVWSFRTNQKYNGTAYDFPIGRVDFHDLVTNGTFNTTAQVKVDGTYMNAANCFSYVAKYVVKRDKPNLNRVRLAYRHLFHTETYCKLYDNEISYSIALQWLLDHGYNKIAAQELYEKQLKQLSYEKTIYQPCETIFEHGLLRYSMRKICGYSTSVELLPSSYSDFKCAYRPFCEFSRGTPIGSLYAKNHLQEFKEGVYNKPLLQDSGYVVPFYFRNKARNALYGFREVHRTISGISFALGSLPDLHRRLDMYNQNHYNPFPSGDIEKDCSYWSKNLHTYPEIYVDLSTGERVTFSDSSADHYKYSRSLRKYILTRSIPLPDYIRSLSLSLAGEFERYKSQTAISKENMRLRDRFLLLLTDLGDDERTVTNRFSEQQLAWLNERSKLYHAGHVSVE